MSYSNLLTEEDFEEERLELLTTRFTIYPVNWGARIRK
jgi:hypothetical protein